MLIERTLRTPHSGCPFCPHCPPSLRTTLHKRNINVARRFIGPPERGRSDPLADLGDKIMEMERATGCLAATQDAGSDAAAAGDDSLALFDAALFGDARDLPVHDSPRANLCLIYRTLLDLPEGGAGQIAARPLARCGYGWWKIFSMSAPPEERAFAWGRAALQKRPAQVPPILHHRAASSDVTAPRYCRVQLRCPPHSARNTGKQQVPLPQQKD